MQRKNIMVLLISLSLVLLLGSSYALLRSREVGTTPYVINVGTLQVTFEEGKTEKLSLENMYPMSDKEGSSLPNELGFIVKNTGTVESYYDITLEETSTNPEFKNVIRFISNKDNQGYNEPKTLGKDKYIDVGGYLEPDASSSYKVKVWLDYNADNTYMDKTFTAKVLVNSFQESNYAKDVIKSKLVKYSESSKDDFQGGLVAVNTNGDLYNETESSEQVREYRYSGSNVNNYVTFNDETWRIIGVFKDEVGEEHVKIAKNEPLNEKYLTENYIINGIIYTIHSKNSVRQNDISWNRISETESENINDWTKAGLQYYLNTEKDDNGTNGYMYFLSDTAKKMLKGTTYYLGNVTMYWGSSGFESNKNIVQVYNEERGNKVCVQGISSNTQNYNCNIWYGNQVTWQGKVALMYPSDVGFTISSKYWNNTSISNYGKDGIIDTSWLSNIINNHSLVLLSPSSHLNYTVTRIISEERFINIASTFHYLEAIPTLYLKSNVKIIGGDGTNDSPYALSLS